MLDLAPSPHIQRFAFEKHDKVTIGEIAYRPVDVSETGYVFVRLDNKGVAESFTRAEIARLVELGRVQHEREALLPENARARMEAPSELLSMMPAEQHVRARGREGAVLAFLELEKTGEINRTDKSITKAIYTLIGYAANLLDEATHYDETISSTRMLTVPRFSARSLRRWVTAYERFGIAGLFDGIGRQGNKTRRVSLAAQVILANCVRGYMTSEQKTQAAIYADVKCAFYDENARRRCEGRAELVRPSKETVRQAILALDPYQCDVARKGVEYARRKYAPIGIGLNLTRPLQRVEMDTWSVDLITLMKDSGLLNFLTDEEKTTLGLTEETKRLWLTVAICATTRCILAMRLSLSPSAQATIQTLDMMMQDKGIWSDAVGSLSPWHMHGHTPYVFTDCGSEYVSYDVRVAAQDLGISLEHAPAGFPEMRARMERLFRTMSINLMPRLTGRTFSNMIERGEYDAKGRAALTIDDLCAVLIRWVVDIYHRSPHEGLGGQTPADCWDELTEKYGVGPAADLRRRRIAFGTRMSRVVGEGGITVLGIRYHSEALTRLMLRRRKRDLNFRWYSEDLGSIAVEVDGEWIEVPSIFRRFDGVRAQAYISARRALQSRFKSEAILQEDVVFQAIADIEAINGNAMRRIGLLVEDWSKDRLDREEEHLFIGFKIEPNLDDARQFDVNLSYGDDLTKTGALVHEGVNEKLLEISADVSEAASSDEFTGYAAHPPTLGDDGDDMDFEFEEK